MSRSRSTSTAAALLWALAAAPAAGGVRLEAAGFVEPADHGLVVRVEVSNRGDAPAARLEVEGEIFGHHAQSALPGGVAAGATEPLWLHFPVQPPRPGVHALALHLAHPVDGGPAASRRACLLLELGARATPPVRVAAAPASFETSGALRLELRSADGRAHEVRVRVLPPRGLNALEEPLVRVPAAGGAELAVPLIRTGASRRERLDVVVVAATETDGVASTAVAETSVELVPHEPVLPRARPVLAAAGALLLAAAVGAEVWTRLKRAV